MPIVFRLPSTRVLAFPLASTLPVTALASPTCGTDQNPSCGLWIVLHWLVVTAIVLSILLAILLVFVIRYYVRTRRATLDDAE